MDDKTIESLIKTASSALFSKGTENIDLNLSNDSTKILTDLITNGMFKDKNDFTKFLIKSFMDNKMYEKLSPDNRISTNTLIDMVTSSAIGKNASETDIQNKLIPLMTEAIALIAPILIAKFVKAKHA